MTRGIYGRICRYTVFHDAYTIQGWPEYWYTVTPKSVTITNLKPGRKAPRNHPWESHFALVGPNRVQTLGYKPIPGSCDSAWGPSRYNSFKTGTPL